MKIILVRHGESEGNAAKVLAYPHTPLTEKGRAQAFECAKRLENYKIDKVLSSPFKRAVETCEYFTDKYEIEELLHEQRTGFEGKTYEEYFNSEFYKQEKKDPLNAKVDGSESLQEVYNRAILLRDKLKTEGGNILCFTHACFMSMLISSVFENPLLSLNLILHNAKIWVMGENMGSWYLEALNV